MLKSINDYIKALNTNKQVDVIFPLLAALLILVFFYRIIIGNAVFPFDYEGYHYPLLNFISHEISNGRFPIYDPYIYSGTPLYLNAQASLFYPIHILLFCLLACIRIEATHYFINLIGIFHLIIGAISFYFLARHYKIRPELSSLGSLLYSLSGHILAQSQHLGVIETFAWLPLIFLLLSIYFRNANLKIVLWICIVVSIIVYTGFLPQVMACLIIATVFSISMLIFRPNHIGRKLSGILFGAVITVCLTSVVTIPLYCVEQQMESLQIHSQTPISFLKTLLWPNIFGTFNWPSYNGPSDVTASYLFAGTFIPVLTVLGLFSAWKRARELTITFIICAIFSFVPITRLLNLDAVLPVFSSLIRPFNFVYFLVLFSVILSLLVIEYIVSMRCLFVSIVALTVIITFSPLLFMRHDIIDIRSAIVTGVSFFFLTSILIFKPDMVRPNIIVAIMVFQLFWVNINRDIWNMPSHPGAVTHGTYRGHEELLHLLKQSDEPYRIAIDNEHMGGAWNASWHIWRLDSIGGFDPTRSQKYFETVVAELSNWHTNRLFNIANIDSPLLNILNVKYYVTTAEHSLKYESIHWKKIYHSRWDIFENNQFHSRFAVIPGTSLTIDHNHKTANYVPSVERAGNVVVVKKQPNFTKLYAQVAVPNAFIFMSERNYKGWKIIIDGHEVEPYEVNNLMMGIPLQEGNHDIVLQFKFPNGKIVIALILFGVLLIVLSIVSEIFIKESK